MAFAVRKDGSVVSRGERVETARTVYSFIEVTEDGKVVVANRHDRALELSPRSLGLSLVSTLRNGG